jgi:hypothetical protein
MSSKINLQTCEYACKSSIFQDNQLIWMKKAKLNPSYLQDKNKNKILESIQGIQWKIKSLK